MAQVSFREFIEGVFINELSCLLKEGKNSYPVNNFKY